MATGKKSFMDYSEQYKSKEWKDKRLIILKRDNLTCLACDTTTKKLHVHHKYYEKNKKVWEYPDDALLTLCEKCHKEYHEYKSIIHEIIEKYFFLPDQAYNLSLLLVDVKDLDIRRIDLLSKFAFLLKQSK